MLRNRHAPLTLVVATALILSAQPVTALSYISIQAGEMGLGNPGTVGEVSPVLLTALGASIPLLEAGPFRLEAALLIWGTPYQYVTATARAVPTQVETADQFMVLGVWVAPLAGLHVTVARGRLELGAAATVALNFRIPMLPRDNGGVYLADAGRYFFGKARFLFPETDAWIKWHAFDDLSLSLAVKVLYPLFHAWDGDGVGLGDQLFVAAVVGFDIRIPRRASPALGAEAEPAAE